MFTKVHKWGNSLALRIPKDMASAARLTQDNIVEMVLVEGQIVLKPVRTPRPSLEQLLTGITSDNLHHETDTGEAVGQESW